MFPLGSGIVAEDSIGEDCPKRIYPATQTGTLELVTPSRVTADSTIAYRPSAKDPTTGARPVVLAAANRVTTYRAVGDCSTTGDAPAL